MNFTFNKKNYQLLILGLVFIVSGYILMIGGGSENPQEFSYKIFDFQRWVLAPVLILIGLVIEIFAIMKKS